VLVLEIRKRQGHAQDLIKKIQNTSKMKEAIGTKIEKLRRLKTHINSEDTDGNSSNDAVTMADVVKAALGEGADVNNKDNIRKACEQFGLMETQFIQDPKTGNVTESAGQGLAKGQSLDNVNANTKVNATLIDEKIQALTDKQQQYGNELEIDMIKLNDMLAKLAQDVQMLANINKSVNERRMGVVQKMS